MNFLATYFHKKQNSAMYMSYCCMIQIIVYLTLSNIKSNNMKKLMTILGLVFLAQNPVFKCVASPLVGGAVVATEVNTAIADKTDGVLPPANQAFLGVNLASGSGGTIPGTYGTSYMYPKFEDLWYFKAKGVRLIRLPFRWQRLQSDLNGSLTAKDVTQMRLVIKEAERLGIWVLLDMHDYCERTVNGVKYEIGVSKVAGATPIVTADHFADAWVKLVNAFLDCKNIWGYDLMNEPKGLDINILKNNYQTVINAIRQVDTKTAIVVEGKNYAGAQSWPSTSDELKNLTDPIGNNIIYAAHTYFDSNNSGTYPSTYENEVKDPKVYKTRLDPFVNWLNTNNKNGMLGEYGVPYNGAKNSDPRYMDMMDSVFTYLKKNQLTSTYWCGGAMYDAYQLTVQPAKDYFTEKSTMLIMEKYIKDFDTVISAVEQLKTNRSTITIYPNPVKNILNVKSDKNIKSAEIFNLQGQEVKTLNVENGKVDVTSISRGCYLVKFIEEDGTFKMKQIIRD